jgi:hypothetical protein
VPVAKDGLVLNPKIQRDGKFSIGFESTEHDFSSFEKALEALQKIRSGKDQRLLAHGTARNYHSLAMYDPHGTIKCIDWAILPAVSHGKTANRTAQFHAGVRSTAFLVSPPGSSLVKPQVQGIPARPD